jgi:hypothetical protein
MVSLKFFYLLALFFPSTTRIPADTSINGIQVQFEYSLAIFPASWQGSPVNAKGEPMPAAEIPRSKTIIATALSKYPPAVLRRNLLNVYFVRSMSFFDASFGGTNSLDAVYISNDGKNAGYTNYYLEQTFHHEFSSILFRNYTRRLDTAEWKLTNISSFDYNDPENGVGSIRKNQTSQEIDTLLCQQGFLTEYSLSSMENDINTYAQNLFCPSNDFWQVTDKYPRIAKKVTLLISFYHNIAPVFTEEYFRKFKPRK